MATFSNRHWLLSQIRNSFISSDETSICEVVMTSDDMPKQFYGQFQNHVSSFQEKEYRNFYNSSVKLRVKDSMNFLCFPGLDISDDEDLDISTQSLEIQLYPDIGAHRFRSNTAQKLEKMELERRKAARTKCIMYEDEAMPPERADFFIKKVVTKPLRTIFSFSNILSENANTNEAPRNNELARRDLKLIKCNNREGNVQTKSSENKAFYKDYFDSHQKAYVPSDYRNDTFKAVECVFQAIPVRIIDTFEDVLKNSKEYQSKLDFQLKNMPNQIQNKFSEYARFDGTSQTGVQTKRINIYLNMLPFNENNYPIKVCALANSKIIEVIGLVCYKATIQFPEIPFKSIRHYALYMTEDNDDMEDFPPLDNREPCSKFGFSQLTLAEVRPLISRIDVNNQINNVTRSLTSEIENMRISKTCSKIKCDQTTEPETNVEKKHKIEESKIQNLSDKRKERNRNKRVKKNQVKNKKSRENKYSNVTQENKPFLKVLDVDSSETEHTEEDPEMVNHNEMIEAPLYRTYRLHLIDKRFFRIEVTLGICSESIEIDQHSSKFWTKQRAFTWPMDSVAFCEIKDRRLERAIIRIWLRSSSMSQVYISFPFGGSKTLCGKQNFQHAKNYLFPKNFKTPVNYFCNHIPQLQPQIRFKHHDFETNVLTAEHIFNKLNYILEVRSSDLKREFLEMRKNLEKKSNTT